MIDHEVQKRQVPWKISEHLLEKIEAIRNRHRFKKGGDAVEWILWHYFMKMGGVDLHLIEDHDLLPIKTEMEELRRRVKQLERLMVDKTPKFIEEALEEIPGKNEYHIVELLKTTVPGLQKLARKYKLKGRTKKSIIKGLLDSEHATILVPEGFDFSVLEPKKKS